MWKEQDLFPWGIRDLRQTSKKLLAACPVLKRTIRLDLWGISLPHCCLPWRWKPSGAAAEECPRPPLFCRNVPGSPGCRKIPTSHSSAFRNDFTQPSQPSNIWICKNSRADGRKCVRSATTEQGNNIKNNDFCPIYTAVEWKNKIYHCKKAIYWQFYAPCFSGWIVSRRIEFLTAATLASTR